MTKTNRDNDPVAPIKEAPDEIQAIIKQVLELEHDHLVHDRPRLNEDIVRIIKNAVT